MAELFVLERSFGNTLKLAMGGRQGGRVVRVLVLNLQGGGMAEWLEYRS